MSNDEIMKGRERFIYSDEKKKQFSDKIDFDDAFIKSSLLYRCEEHKLIEIPENKDKIFLDSLNKMKHYIELEKQGKIDKFILNINEEYKDKIELLENQIKKREVIKFLKDKFNLETIPKQETSASSSK